MPFDPDRFVNDQPQRRNVAGFDPDDFVADTGTGNAPVPSLDRERTPADVAQTAATGAVSTGLTAYGYRGPTGFNPQAVGQALQPLKEVIPSTIAQYTRSGVPGVLKASADVLGVSTVGVPPFASIETARRASQVPAAVSKTASEIGKITSQSMPITSPVTGSTYPSSVPSYRDLQKAVGPDVATDMSRAYAKGGNNAVLRYLESSPNVQSMMSQGDFAKLYETYKNAVPSKMAQVGKVLGPAAKIGARFLGPVGVAMTAYDIGSAAYDMYKNRGQSQVTNEQGVTPAEYGMNPEYIDIDQQIREEAARRAMGQ